MNAIDVISNTSAKKAAPPSDDAPRANQYVAELDTLRAIAIFSVLFCHYLPDNSILNRLQMGLQEGHTFGVPLFFALSGFLITRILVQSRGTVDAGLTNSGHSLLIFYARRVLRIFPIYYATLFVGVAFNFKNVHAALPWHLAYLSNFYYLRRSAWDWGPAVVFWTLAVEEQFYLIWPLIFLLVPTRRLPAITLATAMIGGVFTTWTSDSDMRSLLLPAQMMYLALGGYLGLAGVAPLGSPSHQHRMMRRFLIAIPVFLALSIVARFAMPMGHLQFRLTRGLRYTAVALGYAWIVARTSQGIGGPLGKWVRWGPLTYLGRISYGIYILQFFVTHMMERAMPALSARIGAGPASWVLQSFPARTCAIILVASISWFCMEKPLNELKRYFPYPRKPSRAEA